MESGSDKRYQRRIPFETPVEVRHADLDEFLEEHSGNLSASGMFITTPKPLAPGTRFDFRFSVGDDVTVISGVAEVVWVRERSAGPSTPTGMGVRFVELDDLSREVILRVVELHLARGGSSPFSLD